MELKETNRPKSCPKCGSAKVYKGRIVARKKLNVKQRRWVCNDCGSTWF